MLVDHIVALKVNVMRQNMTATQWLAVAFFEAYSNEGVLELLGRT